MCFSEIKSNGWKAVYSHISNILLPVISRVRLKSKRGIFLNNVNLPSQLKPRVVISIISVLMLLLCLVCIPVACAVSNQAGGASSTQANGLSADEIRQKVLEKTTAVNCYIFEMVMNMRISLPEEKYIDQQSNILGSLDKPLQKMHLSLALTQRIEAGRTQKASANSEIYVAGKAMWVKTSGLGGSGDWQNKAVPDNFWQDQDIITQQTKMLTTAGLKLKGAAGFQGTECYILEVTPDVNALWETLQQQGDLQSMAENFNPQEMIRNISMQVWIDQNTFLLRRVTEDITLLADLSELSVPDAVSGQYSDLKIKIDLTVSNYNADIPFEMPQELVNKS